MEGHVKLGAVNQENQELFNRFKIVDVPSLIVYDGKNFKPFDGDYAISTLFLNGKSALVPPVEKLTTDEPPRRKVISNQRRCTFYI